MITEERERMRTSEFRDIRIERTLIAGMLKYQDIIKKAIDNLRSDVFSSDKAKWIYEQILDFYNKENAILDTKSFEIILTKIEEKERIYYIKFWKSIIKYKKMVKVPVCMAMINRLNKLYQARTMEITMSGVIENLTRALKGGDTYIDQAVKQYTVIADKILIESKNVTTTDPITLYDDFKKRFIEIQKDPEKHIGVPTGIEELDRRMSGLRKSEFGLITGGTGVGKSIMLLDFAFNCYMSYGNVLYVTIEMPESQLRERFYCRLSGITYDCFRKFALNRKQFRRLDRKIAKLSKNHEYTFHILDMPESCTIRSLKSEVETHIGRFGEPKLIVIDYLNIMQGGFDWVKQVENAIGIKQQIARYFKIPTWSANQLMGSKHNKEVIKIQDMGFAKHIPDNIDVGIGIGETELSEEEGIFNISFTKTRDFSAKGFQIKADRSRMTFCKSIEASNGIKFKEKRIGGNIGV